jgi:prepilin-type N-terminal cleavage/methylation domain-containing protein
MHKRSQNESGFSLIEMIVSLGIFSVIVTTAVGALLVLISTNQKLQGEQSVMTNLSFALDSMTREIRTGYNYYCDSTYSTEATGGPDNFFNDNNSQEDILGNRTQDCTTSQGRPVQGLSFYEGGNSVVGAGSTDRRILYFYDEGDLTIKRRVGDGAAQSIISSGLEITAADFIVTGSTPQSSGNNFVQPTVTISIEAREIGEDKLYRLQTTVTQRILDL